MSETRGDDADIPAYPGQDRPADPGAEAMTSDTEDHPVKSPSEMEGHAEGEPPE